LEQKDYERIAKLETQLESLTEGLKRIENKLDAYTANFITRTEADIRFRNIEKELTEVKDDNRANRAFWVSVIALAVTFIFSLLNYLK
jgi:septal ring factor EnvC (AmiA/AmiB activator)